MDVKVYKEVTRHNTIGLKCGEIFRIGTKDATSANYWMFLEKVCRGPEKEDCCYKLFNLKYSSISEVAIDFLDSQNIYKCKARVEVEDYGDD